MLDKEGLSRKPQVTQFEPNCSWGVGKDRELEKDLKKLEKIEKKNKKKI